MVKVIGLDAAVAGFVMVMFERRRLSTVFDQMTEAAH